MNAIYEKLDKHIRPVVLLLRSYGVNTFSSCEGGKGHPFQSPTIRISPRHSDMAEDEKWVAEVLSSAGYGGYYIKQYSHYQHSSVKWEALKDFLEIEFWDDMP